uniref:Uncharacterized protein n=1 Tax=Ananas comosus var. bracteatus TaxID=296719 RepID=A0A6V7NEX6_ANACO|nr:unnamed protein product [Ananas comosus var. bracteatus]
MVNGIKLQQFTTGYNKSFEEALQSARDVNQNLDVLIEALQKEEAKRHEIMMQENARRHEQLLELIRSRFVHAREKEIAVQVPKEEKELIPIPIPLEKGVSSLTNSVIDQPAAVKEVEQKHKTSLQIEANRMCKVKWRDSVSKPEELLKLLATQPPLLGPAHNGPNAYTTLAETGSTMKAVENTTHNSEESLNVNPVEGAATSQQTKMQGRCYGYGVEYITGKQCKDSSLCMLPAHEKGEMGAESETVKEKGYEPQQVEDENVYEATSIKESDNHSQLILNDDRTLHSLVDFGIAKATGVEFTTVAPLIVIADPEHKVLSKSSCSQFARKKPDHILLADSRKLGLKGSDIVLRVDWMKEYRQVPFDPGPNKVANCSMEGEVSPKPIATSQLQRVIHQRKQVEEFYKHLQEPVEYYQARSKDLRVQRQIQNSHLVEACPVWSFMSEYRELGTVLVMPHPCSLSLFYEQAKLKESNRELGYFPPIYVSITFENAREDSNSSWCRQSEQVKHYLMEQLNTTQQVMKYHTDKGSERVLEGSDQIWPESSIDKHSIKALRRSQKITVIHYRPYHLLKQTSRGTQVATA